jgi:hypothetical protein
MNKKQLINIGAAFAMAVGSMAATATPAAARDGYNHTYYPGDYYRGNRGGYDRGYRDNRGYQGYRGDNYYRDGYRGDDRRNYRHSEYRCRDKGAGGAIIGAIAGGLLGNSVAGYGDKTTGTVIGGALGAVAGHAIDKGDGRRC